MKRFYILCLTVITGLANPNINAQIRGGKLLQELRRKLHPPSVSGRGGYAPGELCSLAIPIGTGSHYSDGPSSGGGCYMCNGALNADWYVFTPAQSGFLWIYSCEEGADTRLWIYRSASDCSQLELVAGFDDECPITPDPDAYYYATEAFLQVCSGYNYYLEWDDMWDGSPFNFYVQFFPFSGTEIMAAGGLASEYSHMPTAASGVRGYITALNVGANILTGVKTHMEILQGSNTVLTQTENVSPTLPVCADPETYFAGPYPFTSAGSFTVRLSLEVNETEDGLADNAVENSLKVDTVFARDDGGPFYDLNIGDPIEILGHNFSLSAPDQLTSLSFRLGPAMFDNPIPPGMKTRLYVYSVHPVTLQPLAPLDSTDDYFFGLEDTGWVTIPLLHGPLSLPAGPFFTGFRYYLTSPVELIWGATGGYYMPNRNLWVKASDFPDFISLDSLIIGDNWQNGFALALRANFGELPSVFAGDEASAGSMSLAPNPTKDFFCLKSDATFTPEELFIIDLSGRCVSTVRRTTAASGLFTVDVSSLSPGVYTVRVRGPHDQNRVPGLSQMKLVIAR